MPNKAASEALLVTSLACWQTDGTLAFLQKTQQDERRLRATLFDRASRCATRGPRRLLGWNDVNSLITSHKR
jgi:hypothetical protein